MDFYQVLEKRRTIRDFSDKEVTDDVLKKVLSAAFKAPTNDHLRQFEFIVVRGQENIVRLVLENPLKVVPLIHSNLTPVKFSHSPFCLFLFSSYSSCPLCRVLH